MSDEDDRGEGQGTPFSRRRAEVEFGSLEAAQNCVSILDGSLVDGTFISVRLEGDEDGEEEVGASDARKGGGFEGVEGGVERESLDDDWDIPQMGDTSGVFPLTHLASDREGTSLCSLPSHTSLWRLTFASRDALATLSQERLSPRLSDGDIYRQ